MKSTYAQHLIKTGDLNHHGTFFAGRCAEWLIESSYFPIAQHLDTKHVVLLIQHGINFRTPMLPGSIITFESKLVAVGRSTLTVYTKVYKSNEPEAITAYGYCTFIYLDDNHASQPHGLVVTPENEEDAALQQEATELLKESLNHAKRNRTF